MSIKRVALFGCGMSLLIETLQIFTFRTTDVNDLITKICKNILIGYEDITFAYIFGSHVKGEMRDDSDLDIAIYLKEKIDGNEYLKIKMDLTDVCKREIDSVILNDAVSLLKYEIYKNNILLFTKDKTLESNHKVKILFG